MARSTELENASNAFIEYLKSENDFDLRNHRILDLARAFCNSLQSALFPMKKTDIPFAIFALRTVLSSLVEDDPDAASAADDMTKFFDVTRFHAVIPKRMGGAISEIYDVSHAPGSDRARRKEKSPADAGTSVGGSEKNIYAVIHFTASFRKNQAVKG